MPSVELNEGTYAQWITDGTVAVANMWGFYQENQGPVTKSQYEALGRSIERLMDTHKALAERVINQ